MANKGSGVSRSLSRCLPRSRTWTSAGGSPMTPFVASDARIWPPCADSRYPRRSVDVEARQAVTDALGLARVQAHPNTYLRVVGPRLGCERALPGDGRSDRRLRAVEHDEE